MQDLDIDWTLFLGRAASGVDPRITEEFIRGKRVLITGAGGSIGSALARSMAGARVERLVLLDIAEHGLFELGTVLGEEAVRLELVVGDVCDPALLREVFAKHRPDVVFHAAACKHVSLMETNPLVAARTNILGTDRVLKAAGEAGAGQVVVLSTDKVVEPAGMMGATKRVAELLVMASAGTTKVKAVRLANVLGSSGSVVPTFARQIERGGPLTITDAACTRYFLSMEEAVGYLVSALAVDSASGVIIAESGEPISIVELARFLTSGDEVEVVYTGLRAGEKLAEQMVTRDERVSRSKVPGLQVAVPREEVCAATLDGAVEEIERAVEMRDMGRLVGAIVALVPGYEPSRSILERAG